MNYSRTLSLDCPHCDTKCQFVSVEASHNICVEDKLHHIAFVCTNCKGIIIVKWSARECTLESFRSNPKGYESKLDVYYPLVGDWKPRVKLLLITESEVRDDFKEAINCYNNGFYNASMIMTRRAIQQEMINKKAVGKNLYDQIESMGISKNLKALLQKVKNFGNYGAHPDFCLFDINEEKIENKKEFAKLSLEFLDRYFADEYEICSLVENAPKSEKELNQ